MIPEPLSTYEPSDFRLFFPLRYVAMSYHSHPWLCLQAVSAYLALWKDLFL